MEVRRSYNPLNLKHEVIYNGIELSPNQIIKQEKLIFVRPVILQINGQPILRKDWDICLQSNDICYFVELPGVVGFAWTVGYIVQTIVYGAIAYAIGHLYNKWFGPDDSDTPPTRKSVYSLTADVNRICLGTPFPEQFGRFKNVPYLAQENYSEYEDQEQYVYMLGIIGVGEYADESVYVDETPLADFADSTYHIVPPNSSDFTIIPVIVYTSRSISGQKLSANFITTIVCGAGTLINKMSFDVTLPNGLIDYSSSGDTWGATIYVTTYIREVDDTGSAVTDWRLLVEKRYHDSTSNELRYTETFTLPRTARYEFKINKTDHEGMTNRASTDCYVGDIKGYGANQPNYGDVTLIEVKIKASEQTSSDAMSKINIICTRKLYPITATGFGVTKQTTKSIVDSFAYIVTAENGGQQANAILNFSELYNLRTILSDRDNYFSHIFTSQTIAIEACKTIAKCGRCLPIMLSGLLLMVRDVVKSVPSQIYTDDDYTEKSLSISHRLRIENDPTCVEVEYIDEDTWQVQTVQCYDDNGNNGTPAKISLIGCTNRQHAYEEGMYLYWDDEKNRTTINMTPGLKGLIPAIGDMIYVSSRQIDWGQTGLLAYYNNSVATLSEPVNFLGSETAQIIFSGKNSGIYGPFVVTPLENEHEIAVTLSEAETQNIYDDGDKITKYIFGPAVTDILRIRVLKVIPTDTMSVKIEGTIIHDEVHNDPGTAPPLEGVLTESLPFDPEPDPEDFEDVYIYIYGGHSGASYLQYCDEYTPASNTWISKADIPSPARTSLAASTIGSSGYIYGGYDISNYLQDCDEYTPNTWISKSNIPWPARAYLAASTIGSSSYIYGGSDSGWVCLQYCDEYTPDTWVSRTGIPLPARDGLAASTIDSSGYIYGGYGNSSYLQDCDEYTPDTWVNKTDMPAPERNRLAASTMGNSGYIYGGSDTSVHRLQDCDEYTPTLNAWVSKTDIPSPARYYLASSSIDVYGFICGGQDAVPSELDDCDMYISDIDTWVSKADMSSPGRNGLAASTISQTV